jgi:hypothetical protein
VENAIVLFRGIECYGAFEDGDYRLWVEIREGDESDAI